MKRILMLFMTLSFIAALSAQNNDTLAKVDATMSPKVKEETKQNKQNDTTRLRVGHKSITIVNKDGKTTVDIQDNSEESGASKDDSDNKIRDAVEKAVEEAAKANDKAGDIADAAKKAVEDAIDQEKEDKSKKHNRAKFHSTWNGISIGINNFADKNHNIAGSPDYMSLNSNTSIDFSIQACQLPIRITNNIALVSGLGVEWNNYRFANKNNIMVRNDSIINRPSDPGAEKSKLKTVYFNVPLLMEFHIPTERSPIKIAFGVIGGVRIGTKTKINYSDRKDIRHDDLYIAPFRYGYMASIGYQAINLYANYYPTPLFLKNKGPELYPFSIGVHISMM